MNICLFLIEENTKKKNRPFVYWPKKNSLMFANF